ncbi:MAG: outer membrane lipoprotein chaperone LolA [Nitrosomonas sp.]|jgi:outer membrane lipoprotein carrier protein|nr:outer membrane lipoprotein chaperone LolA [Nitrosomonas sp.]MBP6355308.1 outer membrane lipoprotein chaperone LolA [Nitrosomonas sp.]HQV87560.1 outer membrane lipoprotein chaperone LolA [Nitrosomonas sp.]
MNHSRCARLLLLLLASLMPALTEAAATESLKNFIKETRTVRANFSQTLYDKNARTLQESKGTMLFERPEKFRWTYEKPYEQLIVGDGIQVWFYDQDLNQVTIRQFNIAIGSSPAALLAGSSTIEDNFVLNELGLQNEIEWLEAIPKSKESAFEFIQMGFSPDGMLRIMALRDSFGQTTLLTFSDLEKNPKLPIELFKFTPPANADVISD